MNILVLIKKEEPISDTLYSNLNLKIHKLLVNLNDDEDFEGYDINEERYFID